MIRTSRSWIRAPPEQVVERIQKANESSFYILQELGPAGFLLKSGEKNWKVLIGSSHSCNCPHQKIKGSCIHILWVLLKVFQISPDSELIFQSGLIEREITGIIQERGKVLPEEEIKEIEEISSDNGKIARPICEGDNCPICLESLQSSKWALTHCRLSCGNNIHLKCIKVLMDHQVGSMGFTMVKCPLCRSDFNTVEGLKTELENSSQSQKKNYRDKVQFGLSCSGCKKNPIVGKYHKCNVCKPLHLCDDCFMKGFHDQHTFQNRLTRNSKWMPSSRNVTTVLPSGFINDLQNREITDEDYQTLLLLDSGPSKQASIPLHIVNSFPLYKYRGQTSGKAGKCKICGDLFHLGAMIRKIPWYFTLLSPELYRYLSKSYIVDRWLLNQRTCCPVCGLAAYCCIDNDSEDHITQEAKFIAKSYKIKSSKNAEQIKHKGPTGNMIEIIGKGSKTTDNLSENDLLESSLISFSSFSSSGKNGKIVKHPSNKTVSKTKAPNSLESLIFIQKAPMQSFTSSITNRQIKLENKIH